MPRSIRRPKQSVAGKLPRQMKMLEAPAVSRRRGSLSLNRFHDYSVYGVSLRSQFALPHFRAARDARAALVTISKSTSALSIDNENSGSWFFQRTLENGSTYLRWSSLFEFLVSADGRQILARPLEKSSPETFCTYLLGQVLSFALVKRGLESLHSSAVVINGGAIGFLGDCGQGKSTLLASFVAAGYRQLTDDLLLLKKSRTSIMAFPGPPRIKLMPESARLLGVADGALMNDMASKRVIPLRASQVEQDSMPLRALYVLLE